MRTAHVIRHIHFEHLGILESELNRLGFTITYLEAPLVNFNNYNPTEPDLVIVCGAPIGAYDESIYPFLIDEIDYIEKRLASKKPLFGICLGAQLIARILGGHVGPMIHGKKEIGFAPIQLTKAGENSPLALLKDVPVLHWHGDQFDIPANTERLAETELCPNQAFAIGTQVLGLQFHLEANPDEIESWLVGHASELHSEGIDIVEVRRMAGEVKHILPQAGRAAFTKWLEKAHF